MGCPGFRIVNGNGIEVYRQVQAPRRPSRQGQRGWMPTLDQQVPQVLRNAMSIRIDFEPWINDGVVKIAYDPPQEIEVDHHFHQIERLVDEFTPTRVVIDRLSTNGSTLGTGGRAFCDFFHALVALMKEHQIAAIYDHENPEMLGMSSMMGDFAMSSLVDNIILMNWVELGDAFRLGLTVAKMRTNPTTRATFECEVVSNEGMRVLLRQLSADSQRLPFSRYQGLISRAPTRWRESHPPSGPAEDES